MSKIAPPVLEENPFSDELLRDPHEWHSRLRSAAAVVYLPKYDCYACGRYEEVRIALSDHERFSSADGTGLGSLSDGTAQRSRSPIVEVDPPEHNAVRKPLNAVMSPRLVKKYAAEFHSSAEAIVRAALEQESFDIVTEIVEPYVLKAFPDFLGIADAGRENLLLIGDYILNALGPDNELYRESLLAVEPVMGWMTSKYDRSAMAAERLGALIWKAVDNGEIDPANGETLIRTFLRGGTDTVVSGLSTLLMHLALDEGQWQLLKGNRAKMSNAIDEAVRVESPAQSIFRTTRDRVDLGGYQLEKGKKILCSLGAANRDPLRWADPEKFDLDRSVQGHLGFGVGVHFCIGQKLARTETEAVLGALLDRVDRFEPVDTPAWRMNNIGRRLDGFRVRAYR